MEDFIRFFQELWLEVQDFIKGLITLTPEEVQKYMSILIEGYTTLSQR